MDITDIAWDFRGVLSARRTTDTIVVHHRAGTGDAKSLHEGHLKNGWQGIGYHFYVRRDGKIVRGRPIETVGAHVTGHNDHTIGVCFEGNFEEETMSEAQKKAGSELLAHIEEGYGFGLSVCAHKDLMATACPGKNFPMADIRKRAEALITAQSMLRDGVITKENLENWRAFLSGDAPCPAEYIKTVIGRYQSAMRGGKTA